MDINLEYYKIFYYVAGSQSITLAAEQLAISQPAVSQAVKHLEQALSCPLFVRTTKGVRLTKEGEMLYSYVQRGYETILSGERKLSEMLNLEQGEICIGASDMTLKYFLLPYLEEFHERYPGIRVTVTNAPTPETIRHLCDGRIDFGIVSTPVEKRASLKCVPVKEIRDVFVAGRKFEYLKERMLGYEELMKLPVMCLEKYLDQDVCGQFLASKQVTIRPEFELATSDMLIQFAVRNLRIASVVRNFAEEHLTEGDLFELRFLEEIPARTFCIVANERIPLSAAAATLMNVLTQGAIGTWKILLKQT